MHGNKSSQHVFSQVPKAEIPRSTFVRSHGYKTTFDSGYLIPIYCDEALPGDTFKVNANLFARLATPIVPIMDNLYMDVFFFFVPNRLLWTNWQRFCGEQPNPGDSTDFLVPQVRIPANFGVPGTLYDYMGVPRCNLVNDVCAFWPRAYALCWNEWFRDENLQDRAYFQNGDGPDLGQDYGLLKRGKRHDYFTSALPWPQKGPGVELPLGGFAPVVGLPTGQDVPLFATGDSVHNGPLETNVSGAGLNEIRWHPNTVAPSGQTLYWWTTGLQADLSSATGVTINQMREAFQIQRLFERDARGGTRYTEILKSHFGVTSPDSRLQRPEYLGGGTVNVSINPVAQTAPTVATSTPQGNLAAYGIVGHSGHGFTKSFVEHGVVLGLVSVRADMSYQYGLPRMWSRKSRFDFYWPALAHLGEQSILQKEIWFTGVPTEDDKVFGYQERWAEYRYHPSVITGLFKSNAAGTLDVWHLAQEYADAPQLNAAFIEENPPVKRISAVPSEPDFLLDAYFNITCARPMPTYGVPGLIDHF